MRGDFRGIGRGFLLTFSLASFLACAFLCRSCGSSPSGVICIIGDCESTVGLRDGVTMEEMREGAGLADDDEGVWRFLGRCGTGLPSVRGTQKAPFLEGVAPSGKIQAD